MENTYFTPQESLEVLSLYRILLATAGDQLTKDDRKTIHQLLKETIDKKMEQGKSSGPLNPIIKDLNTIVLAVKEIGLGRSVIMSVLLYEAVQVGVLMLDEVKERFDEETTVIIRGLMRANELYQKSAAVETENFRKLLLTFAEDVRVIFILIAERVYVMRNIARFEDQAAQTIAREASYLYAPLAHRMGLYGLKTELEDLSLKTTSPDTYADIEQKLKETKDAREKYINNFITPLKQKLEDAGFTFSIKGRTKSIYSIWNKIKKKHTPFENIYDIFAIRVILDCPLDVEKSQCWQVYSLVTEKYQPNPKRLRDWLSIPKSNGYESLHTTVMGPEGKWVEVQIRTKRMDEVAEKGLAAHWRYKGIKSEQGMDDVLKGIREILENPEKNASDFMDDFKLDLYDDEVFVFTPNGDLQKLKQGSTVLDFAFNIHSNLGCKCVGAKINGKIVPIRQTLMNGDQVEVLTSSTQTPKLDWLNIVATGKAKTKIKQALKEQAAKEAEIGKEALFRRLKNWKVEYAEGDIMRFSAKQGYKTITDFYQDIAHEKIDYSAVRSFIEGMDLKTDETPESKLVKDFTHNFNVEEAVGVKSKDDVLVIDKDLKGIQYSLAKCCNPIYGDEVFGFVSAAGGIKIHRMDCPNAPQMINRFGYRIVRARWSGKAGSRYPITLHFVGKDNIGVVANITSLVSKESDVTMRSISVDSEDGVVNGNITVLVQDLRALEMLQKKIAAVRGVLQVNRN